MDEERDKGEPQSGRRKPRGVFEPGVGSVGRGGRGVFARPQSGEGVGTGDRDPVKRGSSGQGKKPVGLRQHRQSEEARRDPEGRQERAEGARDADGDERVAQGGPGRPIIVRMLVRFLWAVMVIVAMGAGVLGGVVLFDRVLMPRVVLLGNEVVIPPVAGLEMAEAEGRLTGMGLRPASAAGRHHPAVPGGRVLEVSPPVGMSVKAGRRIHLTPSLGGLDRKVPDVVGLSLRMAEISLSASGLRVRELREAATNLVPPGQVLALSPQAGTDAPATSDVALLVSRLRTPTPFAMPDLRGRDGAEAAAWLRGNGFRVDQQTSDGSGRSGSVLEQRPSPGEPVWPGSEISLTVVRAAPGGQPRGHRG